MIAVVIPCHRVKKHIMGVLASIGPECDSIFVVDDGCPEGTGDHVESECSDPRVQVIRNPSNRGVVMGAFQSASAFGRIGGPLVAGWLYQTAQPRPFLLADLPVVPKQQALGGQIPCSKGRCRLGVPRIRRHLVGCRGDNLRDGVVPAPANWPRQWTISR